LTSAQPDPTGQQPSLRIALLGCGVVGSAVARLLSERQADLTARVGARLQLVGVAVRSTDRPLTPGVDPQLLTTDAEELVARADVVVELMGGIEPARTLIQRALKHGASVVTANKALLADHGPELYEEARAQGVDLYYEAAVAGAIPLLRPIGESLAGDHVDRVLGIVNGTTNYVLDQMDRTGADLHDALHQAQELGYAEADPTADVDGYDAAAKAALLASLAFHTRVSASQVHRQGIMSITTEDVAAAAQMGHVIKLLAICERTPTEDGGEGIGVRVHPALVPRAHPLAGVHGAFNAVFVEARAAGQLMFYGPGAGGEPTASAVLGDLVAVARHRVEGQRGPGESAYADLPVLPVSRARTRYHVSLDVLDRPGVLATVASVFAEHGISLEGVRQELVEPAAAAGASEHGGEGSARLVVVTHTASDGAFAATVEALSSLEQVRSVRSVLRVEGA
jgi:homoserine dehydrogenase